MYTWEKADLAFLAWCICVRLAGFHSVHDPVCKVPGLDLELALRPSGLA